MFVQSYLFNFLSQLLGRLWHLLTSCPTISPIFLHWMFYMTARTTPTNESENCSRDLVYSSYHYLTVLLRPMMPLFTFNPCKVVFIATVVRNYDFGGMHLVLQRYFMISTLLFFSLTMVLSLIFVTLLHVATFIRITEPLYRNRNSPWMKDIIVTQ